MGDVLMQALWLLIVGMGSAFFVLFLIGVSGKFLITWVNTLEEDGQKPAEVPVTDQKSIQSVHMAVITATVQEVTWGEGRVVNIQKIEI
jgi:Na+-transporting methylmalonyl-CoA/oxaloacetate decarboxylase gamma subunit